MKLVNLPKSVTPDLAYLVGVIAGDGSLGYREKKHEYSLKCVGNPKDEQEFYLKLIRPKFELVFGLSPQMRYLDSGTTFGFNFFSKSLVLYLTKYIGLPLSPKYSSLKIPLIIKSNEKLLISFLRGLFDTDGSLTFKKRYRNYPYYPVISFSSKSEQFTREISNCLKKMSFRIVGSYNYKLVDQRAKAGFTIINRIEMNGKDNLSHWLRTIGFFHPKNLDKLEKYWKGK